MLLSSTKQSAKSSSAYNFSDSLPTLQAIDINQQSFVLESTSIQVQYSHPVTRSQSFQQSIGLRTLSVSAMSSPKYSLPYSAAFNYCIPSLHPLEEELAEADAKLEAAPPEEEAQLYALAYTELPYPQSADEPAPAKAELDAMEFKDQAQAILVVLSKSDMIEGQKDRLTEPDQSPGLPEKSNIFSPNKHNPSDVYRQCLQSSSN
eukprot:TRINITY_DN1567_c0_g1_i2.p4 TRINITY_DN1567_c0_g1~~TRINITY_DN1567_c0_g1_i2.p4  ORF type:complete len:205 (+),score=17.60 TRINITY_DN1567_c0_g1_i2:1037-1651(+)